MLTYCTIVFLGFLLGAWIAIFSWENIIEAQIKSAGHMIINNTIYKTVELRVKIK